MEQLFAGSAQAGHPPQQSQPQQVSLLPQSITSQTSQPDGSTTPAKVAPQFQKGYAGKHNVLYHETQWMIVLRTNNNTASNLRVCIATFV